MLKERAAAELHAHVAQFDDAIRELRRGGMISSTSSSASGASWRGHFEVALDAIHRFRPARARRFSHPLQFAFQKLLPLCSCTSSTAWRCARASR